MKPKYTHDCDKCTFIGTYKEQSENGDKQTKKGIKYSDVDVYICQHEKNLERSPVIIRYSDEPSDNTSSPLYHWMQSVLSGEIYY